jgi:cobalt-zinc-cadmium efflux system membrane fusion protein
MAHVVPVVAGIVREVRVGLGDIVKAGAVLAVIESRELTDSKAAFLSAAERERLAQATFNREERLWEKKVSSEQEYLDARQALAEAGIARKSAEQHLRAFGFTDADFNTLREKPDTVRASFETRAPLAGTVIGKHLTLGEHVKADAEVFTIADLSSVWADINVYQKDLVKIRKGQKAVIEIGHGIPAASGTVGWIGHQVDETTRTAKTRITLPNKDGSLRPGLFLTAKIAVGTAAAGILAPKSALLPFEGKTAVFVRTEEGFVPRTVAIGQQNETSAEILAGLAAGETYVSQGAFTLKAQLAKASFGDGHNH